MFLFASGIFTTGFDIGSIDAVKLNSRGVATLCTSAKLSNGQVAPLLTSPKIQLISLLFFVHGK